MSDISGNLIHGFNSISISNNIDESPRDDLSTLFNDVSVIIQCYTQESTKLDIDNLKVMPGDYLSTISLYGKITRMIQSLQHEADIMDLMPYIDEYLEYYSQISC